MWHIDLHEIVHNTEHTPHFWTDSSRDATGAACRRTAMGMAVECPTFAQYPQGEPIRGLESGRTGRWSYSSLNFPCPEGPKGTRHSSRKTRTLAARTTHVRFVSQMDFQVWTTTHSLALIDPVRSSRIHACDGLGHRH